MDNLRKLNSLWKLNWCSVTCWVKEAPKNFNSKVTWKKLKETRSSSASLFRSIELGNWARESLNTYQWSLMSSTFAFLFVPFIQVFSILGLDQGLWRLSQELSIWNFKKNNSKMLPNSSNQSEQIYNSLIGSPLTQLNTCLLMIEESSKKI